MPADEERPPGPRLHVIVLRARGDLAARAIADEAATLLRGTGREVVAADALPPEPADGLLVVATAAADIAPLVADASSYRGRAIALAIVADEVRDGAALALRLRKALRAAGAFVLDRQLVVPRSAFGVYGLESEPHRERLDALAILLEHDADRLLAKREGWFEPGEMHPSELLTREPEDAEDG